MCALQLQRSLLFYGAALADLLPRVQAVILIAAPLPRFTDPEKYVAWQFRLVRLHGPHTVRFALQVIYSVFQQRGRVIALKYKAFYGVNLQSTV